MAVKLKTASGVEVYLNPDQITLLMPHPTLIGQTVAVGGGVTEFFNMYMDDLAGKLWPETSTPPKSAFSW